VPGRHGEQLVLLEQDAAAGEIRFVDAEDGHRGEHHVDLAAAKRAEARAELLLLAPDRAVGAPGPEGLGHLEDELGGAGADEPDRSVSRPHPRLWRCIRVAFLQRGWSKATLLQFRRCEELPCGMVASGRGAVREIVTGGAAVGRDAVLAPLAAINGRRPACLRRSHQLDQCPRRRSRCSRAQRCCDTSRLRSIRRACSCASRRARAK
jgi:hypothetical protein